MEKTKLPKALPYVLVVIAIGLIAIILISGFPRILQNEYTGEIRSYQGESLSSIAEVQENEITGLQNIDQAAYRLIINGSVEKPLELTYSEVINNHQSYLRVATLYCVEGVASKNPLGRRSG